MKTFWFELPLWKFVRRLGAVSVLSLMLAAPLQFWAQDDVAKAWKRVADDAWGKAWEEVEEEAFATIEDDPALPRVLLIGDSISMVYTGQVRRLLRGKANVHHPPMNCGSTIRGLEDLGEWLGNKKWDVIHFNWGLHDLIVMPNGSNRVPLEQYKINLITLVQQLKKTHARLV